MAHLKKDQCDHKNVHIIILFKFCLCLLLSFLCRKRGVEIIPISRFQCFVQKNNNFLLF